MKRPPVIFAFALVLLFAVVFAWSRATRAPQYPSDITDKVTNSWTSEQVASSFHQPSKKVKLNPSEEIWFYDIPAGSPKWSVKIEFLDGMVNHVSSYGYTP